jgi:predicted nuclease of predicted toxin-antitoxin system
MKARNYDALHVRDLGMATASDDAILARAAQDGRVLISRDADFSALLALGALNWPSFVHLRIPSVNRPEQQADLLIAALEQAVGDLERGAIVTLQDGRLRIRRLPVERKEP